jgi:molybdopterin molybdotransferase
MATISHIGGVLTFDQAYETVLTYCRSTPAPPSRTVKLERALGRVLAETILADRDFPPFHRSTRDGYALRSADLATLPAMLRKTGQIKAGGKFTGTVSSGEAVEIMTGAAVPAGADAVVMVEYTAQKNGAAKVEVQVEVQRAVVAGENVVAAGAEARAGDKLLPKGMRLGPAQIAMAAAVGKATLKVSRKPRVAILATGDELVEVAETPGPHQIRNSNTYSLAAQVEACGGSPILMPIAPDEELKLAALIQAGLGSADLLLMSGGVSMGKFDLVEKVLTEMAAEFFFTGALIQPGKPVVFGQVLSNLAAQANFANQTDGSTPKRSKAARKRKTVFKQRLPTPFFGLPGNPVSVMTTFDLFVRPVIEALGGCVPSRLPAAKARLRTPVKAKTGLTRFLPAILHGDLKDPHVEAVPWQGSGDVLASSRANCYLVIPPDRDQIPADEMVTVLMR